MAVGGDRELLIQIRADIRDAVTQLRAVQQEVTRTGRAAGPAKRNVDSLGGSFRFLRNVVGAYLSLRTAVQVTRTADAYAALSIRIRTASRDLGDHVAIQRELERISRENGTALRDTVALFQRLAQAAPELGATADDLLRLTNAVQQIGFIGGSTPDQMTNALLQFGQMLTGGVARAEEMNSLLENMPELAVRIARGMGLTVGELRRAVIDGKVLSRDVFLSLLGQTEDINAEVADMPDTLARAGQDFSTSWSRALGILDEMIQGTTTLARLIRQTSDILSDWATARDPNSRDSDRVQAELNAMLRTRESLVASLQAEEGGLFNWLTRIGNRQIQQQIDDLDARIAQYQALVETLRASEGADRPPPVGGAAGGGSDEPSEEEKDRVEAIEKLIKALEDEAATIGKTAEQIALYRLEQLGATEADKERARAALDSAADRARQVQIDETIAALQREAAAMGLTAEQAAVYQLSLLGASESEIELARQAVRASEAIRAHQDDMRAGAEVIERTRTDTERLNAEVAELVRLYEAGALGAVGSAEAIETLRRAAVGLLEDLEEEGAGTMDALIAATKGWGDEFTNTLADMVIDGKARFRDLAESIMRDILRIAIYQQVTAPFLEGIGILPQRRAEGGPVIGPGGPTADQVPILASNGEYVVRASAVRHYGLQFLADLNAMRAPRFAAGGLVGLAALPRFAAGGQVTGAPAGPGRLEVSIDNRGPPARVAGADVDFQPDKMVVRILLEDIERNGAVTQRLANTFRMRRF